MADLWLADRPLVDLRLFKVSLFTASSTLLFLSGFVLYGALVAASDLASPDALVVRHGYFTLSQIGWDVLIPLSLASLAPGSSWRSSRTGACCGTAGS